MEYKNMEKVVHAHTIESTKTDRKGAFLCPQCGTKISPDDTSEKSYTIIEARVGDSGLEEVHIYCKKCRSQINLTGFSANLELSKMDNETESTMFYITHI